MRFVLGIVIGALLVVGAAYVHDAAIDPAQNPAVRPMVNWDVVSETLRSLNGWFHQQWEWLNQQLHGSG